MASDASAPTGALNLTKDQVHFAEGMLGVAFLALITNGVGANAARRNANTAASKFEWDKSQAQQKLLKEAAEKLEGAAKPESSRRKPSQISKRKPSNDDYDSPDDCGDTGDGSHDPLRALPLSRPSAGDCKAVRSSRQPTPPRSPSEIQQAFAMLDSFIQNLDQFQVERLQQALAAIGNAPSEIQHPAQDDSCPEVNHIDTWKGKAAVRDPAGSTSEAEDFGTNGYSAGPSVPMHDLSERKHLEKHRGPVSSGETDEASNADEVAGNRLASEASSTGGLAESSTMTENVEEHSVNEEDCFRKTARTAEPEHTIAPLTHENVEIIPCSGPIRARLQPASGTTALPIVDNIGDLAPGTNAIVSTATETNSSALSHTATSASSLSNYAPYQGEAEPVKNFGSHHGHGFRA